MKKRQQTKVPENFWTTPEGAALYDTLHSDGWDAVDMLNSVKEAFDKAIHFLKHNKGGRKTARK